MKIRRAAVVLALAVAMLVAEFALIVTVPAEYQPGVSSVYAGKKYVKCKKMYKKINKFRTKKKVWQWKKGSKKKQYFNTKKSNKLRKLKRDKALEKTARKRAKEISRYYAHERPNGKSCFSIYPKKFRCMGENIAMGYETVDQVMEAWEEEDCKYSGQGHRRNLLYKKFKKVGVACYEVNGYKYWVQCFGG
ncbi:MAG: CAP domain-containing protein [Eubacterium sp.]|nr:CAP domain-containing protein [Eubacterium sp.]